MAGTINLSLSQRFNIKTGKPLSGGRLYFYAAGTTTPQNAFSDAGLTNALPNPIILDEGGNIPQFFLADGSIKIRLISADGEAQIAADNLLVIGPSSGDGGGGGTVDPTTILTTGDTKIRYGTGVLPGFVRGNGRSIGSSTSGATERANADCQPLYEYLYATDTNLAVAGGRGASASADWIANKALSLPTFRGKYLAFFDGMGNSAAGSLTSTYLGVDADTIGLIPSPTQSRTLIVDNLPPYTPAGTVTVEDSNNNGAANGDPLQASDGSGFAISWRSSSGTPQGIYTARFTGTAQGGLSTPVGILPPTGPLMTLYFKL